VGGGILGTQQKEKNMPGNPDGQVTDKYILHPNADALDDIAEAIYSDLLELISTVYGESGAKENTELIVETVVNKLAEITS
jgi:hypothetical protein